MATQSLNLSYEKISHYEEFHDLMPKWGYAASAFVLFLIGFFGFFLNLLVIILMFKDKQVSENIYNTFLIHKIVKSSTEIIKLSKKYVDIFFRQNLYA